MQNACVWGLKTWAWTFARPTTCIISSDQLNLSNSYFLVSKNGTIAIYFWVIWKKVNSMQCVLNNTWQIVGVQQMLLPFFSLLFLFPAREIMKFNCIHLKFIKSILSTCYFFSIMFHLLLKARARPPLPFSFPSKKLLSQKPQIPHCWMNH